MSAWLEPGVQTSTSCTSSRASTAFQSVSDDAQPSFAAAACAAAAFRPQRTVHPDVQGKVEDPADRAPGLRVGGAHEGVAHHAHPQWGLPVRCGHERSFSGRGQDSKPSDRYWSTLSFVMVSDASVSDFGTCFSTRSDMPLPCAISRASAIAEDAMLGL